MLAPAGQAGQINLLVATAGQQVTNDAADQRGASDARPGVVTNVLIRRFGNIAYGIGRFLLKVLNSVSHVLCIHQVNVNPAI